MAKDPEEPVEDAAAPTDATQGFEDALAQRGAERYVLRLYVSGSTARSQIAIANLKRVCEEHLPGRYDLQVIDVYQQPQLAAGDQVIAVPTLVKELPLPVRRLIGNLSAEDRVLVGLNLVPEEKT